MPAGQFDLVVIGNAGVDSNVYLVGDAIDFTVESNFTQNIDYIGQAGGYSGRGFAQMKKKHSLCRLCGRGPQRPPGARDSLWWWHRPDRVIR